MRDEVEVIIEADGTVTFVHDDDLADALVEHYADAAIQRASHVEPTDDGRWTADLSPVGGPVLGPYTRRAMALDEEVAWLKNRMAEGKLTVA